MNGSILESLLLGFVLLAGLLSVAFLTGGFLLWRYGRRKIRSFRSHGAVIGAAALWDVAASNRWNRAGAVVTSAELQQWSAARVGKEMWRSVDRATAAVRAADELGGPTAELPSLCRRLQAPPSTSTRCCALIPPHRCRPQWANRCLKSCGPLPTSSRRP